MNDNATGLVLAEPRRMELVRPLASPTDLLKARSETRDAIVQVLKQGTDIIRVPKTDKDCLSKAGAETVCFIFGCHPEYTVVEQEIDHDRENEYEDRYKGACVSIGLYRFIVRARIVRQDGLVVGEGIGSCSTLESKYISRPRDCENTALKMAQKRAFVAAVLNGFGLSDRLTQDVEDFVEGEVVATVTRSAQAKKHQTKPAPRAAPKVEPRPVVEHPSRYASLSCMRDDLSSSDFVCNVASDLDEALADGVSDTEAIDAIEARWLAKEQHIRNAELRTGVAAYIAMCRQQALGMEVRMPSDPDEAAAQSVGFAKLHELRKTRGRITTPPSAARHD